MWLSLQLPILVPPASSHSGLMRSSSGSSVGSRIPYRRSIWWQNSGTASRKSEPGPRRTPDRSWFSRASGDSEVLSNGGKSGAARSAIMAFAVVFIACFAVPSAAGSALDGREIEASGAPSGPGVGGSPYNIIFHPSTAQCVLRKSVMQPLELGPCAQSEGWSYTPQRILTLKGTYFCLQVTGDGINKPAKLGITCQNPGSQWDQSSDSKMHLSTKLADGSTVCLDVGPNNTIITNPCKCMNGDRACEPSSQWFKIVSSARASHSGNSSPHT